MTASQRLRPACVAALGVVFISLACTTVIAQEAIVTRARERRPFRGLFGPGEREERRDPRMTFTLSTFAGVDADSRFAQDGVFDSDVQSGRFHQGANAALAFSRRRPRSQIALQLHTSLRYYPDLRRITTQKHSESLRVALTPTRRLAVQVAQSVSYSPTYQLALGHGSANDASRDLQTADIDYSVAKDEQLIHATSAVGTYTWDAARVLAVNYYFGYTDFFARPDYKEQRLAARYTRQLSRDFALRLGYGLGTAVSPGAPTTRTHDLDLGVNYQRSVLLTPRTAIGFASGSTVVSTGNARHFAVVGNARLSQILSSRWISELAYQRSVQTLDTLPRPYMTATLSGTVRGYAHRRVSARFTPSYTTGVALADESRTYRSSNSQTRVDVAVSRHWALYFEHVYYTFRFAPAPDLPPALAAGLNRHGVRWGLALWAPIIR